MTSPARIGAARLMFWLLLAAPAAWMGWQFARGATLAMDLLHPSGELSIRLMLAALLAGPFVAVFGPGRFGRGWIGIRRNLGVAAFGYAALHLLFYLFDMQSWPAIADEFGLPGIWTGWWALALLLPPAAISSDRAMRWLRQLWKPVQRLVYPAFVLAIAHWLLLDWQWKAAALHALPLALLWAMRLAGIRLRLQPERSTT